MSGGQIPPYSAGALRAPFMCKSHLAKGIAGFVPIRSDFSGSVRVPPFLTFHRTLNASNPDQISVPARYPESCSSNLEDPYEKQNQCSRCCRSLVNFTLDRCRAVQIYVDDNYGIILLRRRGGGTDVFRESIAGKRRPSTVSSTSRFRQKTPSSNPIRSETIRPTQYFKADNPVASIIGNRV